MSNNDYNGHNPAELVEVTGEDIPLTDRVAGDPVAGDDVEAEDEPYEASIYVSARFAGGPSDRTLIRDVSVSIPVREDDTFADYAIAIEAAVREIGRLGYLPGYQAPEVDVVQGVAPSWESR